MTYKIKRKGKIEVIIIPDRVMKELMKDKNFVKIQNEVKKKYYQQEIKHRKA
jgi:hypothetical protein